MYWLGMAACAVVLVLIAWIITQPDDWPPDAP